MSDKKAEAVKAKAEGNKHFKAKNFDKAIESYTKAIELDPEKVGGECDRKMKVIEEFLPFKISGSFPG